MARNIRIKAVPNQAPDVRLYVLALIALARQLQEEERAAEGTPPPASEREAGHG